MKSLTSNQQDPNCHKLLHTTTKMSISDPNIIANKFCEIFTNMRPDLAKRLPPSDISHSSFLKNRISETIFMKPVQLKLKLRNFRVVLKQVKHLDMMALRLLMLNPVLISLPHLLLILLTYLFWHEPFQFIKVIVVLLLTTMDLFLFCLLSPSSLAPKSC